MYYDRTHLARDGEGCSREMASKSARTRPARDEKFPFFLIEMFRIFFAKCFRVFFEKRKRKSEKIKKCRDARIVMQSKRSFTEPGNPRLHWFTNRASQFYRRFQSATLMKRFSTTGLDINSEFPLTYLDYGPSLRSSTRLLRHSDGWKLNFKASSSIEN